MSTVEVENELKAGNVDRMDRHRLLRRFICHVPYSVGSLLLRVIFGNPLAHCLLGKHVSSLKKLSREINGKEICRQEISRYLQVNFTIFWRLQALADTPKHVFEKYVRVEGLEHLQNYAGSRGVVLCNSHYGAGKLVSVVIAKKGYNLTSLDRVSVINPKSDVEGMGTIDSIELGKKGANFLLKQIFQMKKALDNKQILHVAADGFRGASGSDFSFLGKKRSFRQSFAELSIATEAVVIPVFSTLKSNGEIVLELTEPLDPCDMVGTKEERVTALCQKYISQLESRWRDAPENVFKNDLQIFSELDAINTSAAG